MGCFQSLCPRSRDLYDEQYEMLVASKPAPISLEKVSIDKSDSDVPLFEVADSDENEAFSNPESVSDEEINQYSRELNNPKRD